MNNISLEKKLIEKIENLGEIDGNSVENQNGRHIDYYQFVEKTLGTVIR